MKQRSFDDGDPAEILFFACVGGAEPMGTELPEILSRQTEVWRPRLLDARPKGFPAYPFLVWWIFHYLRVFRAPDYQIFTFRENGNVVHRTCVFPPFFRFPFMAPGDLQVGDVWTHEAHRGRGLSATMLRHVIRSHPGRRIWFLCEAGNTTSRRLAVSAKMKLCGVGHREARLGIHLLAKFVITSPASPET